MFHPYKENNGIFLYILRHNIINFNIMEEEIRRQAVEMVTKGISITEIATQLNRSRQWVYKWAARSSTGNINWNESQSRAPRAVANKISPDLEAAIVAARKMLLQHPHKESGAYPILHELKRQGIQAPSIATINRVLKKHGLTQAKPRYAKSGIDYPQDPLNMQIMDLVGPRYLRGAHRFFLLNIISNDTRHAGVYPILSKSAEDITRSVTSFWKSYTIPDFLQMDNELSFKGSNRHPRGLGLLLRTALSLDVTPRFIPMGEPWRNGVIERFNQKVEKTLLSQEHKDFDDLVVHSAEFVETHNREHHYSTLQHKTPFELNLEYDQPINPLKRDYIVGDRPPIDSCNLNEIGFIRLVRSDCLINILNTEVKVNSSLMHSYVEAILNLNGHRLMIYQDGIKKQSVEFAMPVI